MAAGPRIVADTRAQIARLSNIEHTAFAIEHAVNTRRAIERFEVSLDNLISGLLDVLPVTHTALILSFCFTFSGPQQPQTCPLKLWITLQITFGCLQFSVIF